MTTTTKPTLVRKSYYEKHILPKRIKLSELFSINTEIKYPEIYNLAIS